MNIKQAEIVSGISKRNIRFYEKEGLICPNRNKDNDYRQYSEEDIERLKLIRMLRMVDMPLEQIKDVVNGEITLEAATANQKKVLKEREKELEIAIDFCEELEKRAKKGSLNVDDILKKMEQPENQNGLFKQWLEDYKKVAKTEHLKTFVFYPDTAVTTPAEFTLALCQYAEDQKADLFITKEGMYPEFTLDGVEYTAERYYRTVHSVPVAAVRCTMMYPELYEADVPEKRKRVLKMIHYSWIFVLFVLMCLPMISPFSLEQLWQTWEGRVILLAGIVMAGVSVYYYYLFYYNERG